MYSHFLVGVLLLLTFVSCNNDTEKEVPDVSDIEVNVEVRRLEQEIFALKSKDEIVKYLIENPEIEHKYFLQAGLYPSRAYLVDALWDFRQKVENDTLKLDADRIFGDFEKQKKEFEQAFKYIKYHFPDFVPPKIYTSVSGFANWGFGGDVIDFGDFIVIGLDYFEGETATYRVPEVPNYILKRYSPNYLVPFTIQILSNRFNKVNANDRTVLSHMIAWGKAYEFVDEVLPYVPDTIKVAYTEQQLVEVNYNEGYIWSHFVENELLYKSERMAVKRYVDDRPTTSEISGESPGRIGRWLGWRIVGSYMKANPKITLSELMADDNANKILRQSKYKPLSRK
ncbi:gliding motility lipoprotein GldB [Flammeovirga sp. EKP202]|uniref:gliding motility lipoprotein GldB n=1 Tax=Flammeovirga sp. EKP202 TaxID=2770592 RepID=UPI00165FC7BD|nr:gliding motility lipoprotein GldB [Flammeovirga sp. EKP202]MBD0404199.1 gliding motility lipoprotein GldB [Flammeovirga sp. EKP202]